MVSIFSTQGHLEMVKFLLDAGADQEHKTDEMHTALMEASMDGHVEVARLLLDHGAQVGTKKLGLFAWKANEVVANYSKFPYGYFVG